MQLDLSALRNAAEAGYSANKIAKLLSCDRTSILLHASRNNIEIKVNYRNVDRNTLSFLGKLVSEGHTENAISQILGLSLEKIRYLKRINGFKKTHRRGKLLSKQKWFIELIEKIKPLWNRGNTLIEISHQINRPLGTVCAVMRMARKIYGNDYLPLRQFKIRYNHHQQHELSQQH